MNVDGYGGGPYDDEHKKLRNKLRKRDAQVKAQSKALDAAEDALDRAHAKYDYALTRWLDAEEELSQYEERQK